MSQKNQEKVDLASPAENMDGEKEKKHKKEKQQDVSLPFLVELVFQFSGLFLLLVTVSVALISFLSGAHFVEIFIRTGATIVVCGVLMLILSSYVSQGVLEAAAKADKQGESIESLGSGKDVKA